MLGFWKTTTPWRFKRLVFRSKVYAAIIDGLETYELSELEVGRVNKCLMQYLRRLCGREGKLWDSKRDLQVEACWVAAEAMSKDVPSHDQVITAVLGDLSFEEEKSTLSEGGGVLGSANPWARRWAADLAALLDVESARWFAELYEGDVRTIFGGGEAAEAFRQADCSELRRAC
eukprot:10068624-Lingulodinium_polyedra.AAC.1